MDDDDKEKSDDIKSLLKNEYISLDKYLNEYIKINEQKENFEEDLDSIYIIIIDLIIKIKIKFKSCIKFNLELNDINIIYEEKNKWLLELKVLNYKLIEIFDDFKEIFEKIKEELIKEDLR